MSAAGIERSCIALEDAYFETTAHFIAEDKAVGGMRDLIDSMRDIAGLAQMGDVEDPAELRAALSDILEIAIACIAERSVRE